MRAEPGPSAGGWPGYGWLSADTLGRGAAPWHTGVLPMPPWVMGRDLHPSVLEDEGDFSSSSMNTERRTATLHHHPLTTRLQQEVVPKMGHFPMA